MSNLPKQILKNTTALMVGRVSHLVGSFVLSYVLARTLSVSGLGIYATIFSYYSIAAVICSVGIRSYLTRDIARDLSNTNRYMMHAGVLTGGMSLLGNIVFFLIVSQLHYEPETIQGIIIINWALFPATWGAIYESVFVAHQKAEYLTYTILLNLLARIGVSIYLLLTGHGIISLIVVQVVSEYLGFAICTFFLVRYIVKPHWEFDWAFARQMLKDLRTFTAIGFLASMFSQVEILLLSLLGGETAVGIYSAASKLILMWLAIPESYMRAVFPVLTQLYGRAPADFRQLVERSIKYLLAVALPLAVGIVAIADKIVLFFYGDDFTASIPVLRWSALIFIPIFLNEVLWRILVARDEQHLALRTQIAGVLTKAGVSLLAVPFISYNGTLLAVLVTQAVYTTLHILYVQRRDKPIPVLRLGWRLALAAAGMGVGAWILGNYTSLWVIIPVAIVLYGGLVFLFRAFSPDEIAAVRRLVRR